MSEMKLPHFVLNRNHTLISKTGLAVRFEKGVARPVQAVLVPEVVGIGAERVDGEQGDGFEEPKRLPEEPQGHEREDLIKAAIEDLVERNSSKDFNAGGVPKPVAIKAIVGFQPEADEVKKAWLAYQAEKSE